ncbi:uncharacterized protein LOC119094488 [Pollicipes pollicipes]|uniref:uncharacterized protein LOC119094488 n=1 Tax=Pollicipes pollicipes TaxID=41117 RepID=UPI0018850545|nr:uncharacterized protein LOC119094488 [Pollicipes pollicipes]
MLQSLLTLLLALAAARAKSLNLMECLVARPLQDIEGNALSADALQLHQISAPQTCVGILCTADVMTVHGAGGVTYASVSVDERTAEGARCLDDVRKSRDAYRKSNFPVTFYAAGDLHLVFYDSSCSAGRLAKQRLLLLSALKGSSIQPLEAFILCDSDLQVTRPAMHVQPHSQRGAAKRSAVTHVTMYSGPQARSAAAGFVPQYARLELARDLVVSVLSSCVGDPAKMELINKLGATWLGEMDSCMRLICHSNMEELALGYYNYILYDDEKMEGEACFKALQSNDIGTTVDTPLTQVRVVSADDDSCTGTKIMVLNPTYSGTSKKLAAFPFLPGKLAQLGQDGGAVPAKSEFSYQCANLLCDSRVGLTPSAFKKNAYKVTVDTEKMRPLNNVCFKSLGREKAARGADAASSLEVDVASLGVSLQFSLL